MTELQCLRDQCLAAFGKYAQEAQKTFGLFGDLGELPVSLDQLLAILEQTQIEGRAQEAYQLLRQQLFELLEDVESPLITVRARPD
jgi:hypothetical protein